MKRPMVILRIFTAIVSLCPISYGLSNDYYEFSEDGKECIIKRYDTPVPWLNFLNNDLFQTWITNTGNFEAFMLDRRINALTNPEESSGYVYIRDRDDGQYFMINKPASGAKWQCRHGLGYTTLETSRLDLSASVTYYVPRDDNVLVWLVTIQNNSSTERHLDV